MDQRITFCNGVDGRSIACAVAGNGPPLLWLHSLYGVDALSPTVAWAVGYTYDGSQDNNLILRLKRGAWKVSPSPSPGQYWRQRCRRFRNLRRYSRKHVPLRARNG